MSRGILIRHAIPVFVALGLAAALVSLCLITFNPYGETDWSLPPCSHATCPERNSTRCRYTDSPCRGRYCNKDCASWYDAVVANDGVPFCTCEKFCGAGCFTPTCTPCHREELPLWIRDQSGPLGTGLLCCAYGESEGHPDPCCAAGHKANYGKCCELEAPVCHCGWSSPITLASFDPRSIGVGVPVLTFFPLSVLALVLCRRPLPAMPGPRGADVSLITAYIMALLVGGFAAKQKWELSFKPADLMPAGILGGLCAFALTIVLLPLDRTNVIFKLSGVPFERAVKFHRWAGYMAVGLLEAHGLWEAWVQGLSQMLRFESKSYGFGNAFGLTSGVAALALVVASAWPCRRGNYELFLWMHRVFATIIFVAGALHCFAFATLGIAAILLHGLGILSKRMRRTPPLHVLNTHVLGRADVDSEALLLTVSHQENISESSKKLLPPGVWFLLQVPGSAQWHPYSLAADSPSTTSFLIKNMGRGTWSSRVVAEPPSTIRMEGPYGGPGFFPGHCTGLVLVGGGVGLSALARLWQHPPQGVSRVALVWVTRCPETLDWLVALLPHACEGRSDGSSIQIFVTRQGSRSRLPSLTWAAGVTEDDGIDISGEASVGGNRPRAATAPLPQRDLQTELCETQSWHGGKVGSPGGAFKGTTDTETGACSSFARQESWKESSVAASQHSSELVQKAAALPWEPHAGPVQIAPHLTLRAGRPDLSNVFADIAGGAQTATWGVIACGPHVLVEEARHCAFDQGMRFHAEEFAY